MNVSYMYHSHTQIILSTVFFKEVLVNLTLFGVAEATTAVIKSKTRMTFILRTYILTESMQLYLSKIQKPPEIQWGEILTTEVAFLFRIY